MGVEAGDATGSGDRFRVEPVPDASGTLGSFSIGV